MSLKLQLFPNPGTLPGFQYTFCSVHLLLILMQLVHSPPQINAALAARDTISTDQCTWLEIFLCITLLTCMHLLIFPSSLMRSSALECAGQLSSTRRFLAKLSGEKKFPCILEGQKNRAVKISELIHSCFWPQYSIGCKSILKPLKRLGRFACPMTWKGRLIVPVAFTQTLMATLSLLRFLSSVDLSKEAASVLSGNKRKLSLISSQLKFWLSESWWSSRIY